MITKTGLGRALARIRRQAGLTQAELARRMGTKQEAISRIEAGRAFPSLPFLERFSQAVGRPLELRFGGSAETLGREDRRDRVRRVLGGFQFNPWDRNPTPAEAKTLNEDGLTRERFEGANAS